MKSRKIYKAHSLTIFMENDTEEYYLDWLGDNKKLLISEFIEENEDSFAAFCKEAFNEEKTKWQR